MGSVRFIFKSTLSSRALAYLLLLLLGLGATHAFAQGNEGAIAGNVLDSSGAAVSGAQIVAKGAETGTTYTAVSTNSGSFRIGSMVIGRYDVTVTATGFKMSQQTGVIVQIATTSNLPVILQVGGTTEVVSVSADAPTIQTDNAELGSVVMEKQVLDLPLALGGYYSNMRSPENFVFLAPGTVGPGTANGTGGTGGSKITGGQNFSTEVLLDGASTYRSENGSAFDETAPSVEALTEFKVITSTPQAEYGRTTGGVETFSTKSGTNAYHGDLYDIFRNEALEANTWAHNLAIGQNPGNAAAFAANQRGIDRRNDYGGTLGGPVRIPHLYNGRDKTFFFFSFEQFRQKAGATIVTTVPTVQQRAGDFSQTLTTQVAGVNPCDGTTIYTGQIFDPATTRANAQGQLCRTAFPGNKIPAGYAIPGATKTIVNNILAYYPAPTNNNLFNNFSINSINPTLDTSMSVRIDQNLTSKQKLYVTYHSRDNVHNTSFAFLPNIAGGPGFQDFFTHYVRIGHDYTLTPSLLNHLNLGYNRTNSFNAGAGAAVSTNFNQQLGISGGGNRTFPTINVFEGITGLGNTFNGDSIDNGLRFNDSVVYQKGRHQVQFGGDYRYQQFSPINHNNEAGDIDFDRLATAGSVPTNGLSGNGFASLLLGLPGYGNLAIFSEQPRWLYHYYAVYLQDTWKLTQTLTLNLGLRYDVDAPRHETHGNTSNLSLTTPNPAAGGLPGALVFAGVGPGRNGNVNEQWASTYHKDFGPRASFAWAPASLNNTFVLRGGAGVYYGAIQYADYGGATSTGFVANPQFLSPDGFNPAFNLATGFPTVTPPPNLDPTQANFGGYPADSYIDPSYGRPASIYNWSLQVEQQLAPDFILNIAYVGQRGTHLRSSFDPLNSITPDKLALGNLLNANISSAQATAAGIKIPYTGYPGGRLVGDSLRPHPQFFTINGDCCLENYGQSGFQALETSLVRRFRNGVNFQAAYTWSKTLTDADSALPYLNGQTGGGLIQNPFNSKGEKSLSNQDIPFNLVLSYLYELPFGKGKMFLGKGGVMDRVVGGWQVGGIQRYISGQPLSFYCANGAPGFDGCFRYSRNAGQPLKHQGPLNVALQDRSPYDPVTNPNPQRYFNYGALYDQNNPNTVANRGSYQFGNVARTTGELRSFFYKDEDFNIVKRTRLTERLNLRLDVTLIDAFNRHVFNRPISDGPNDINSFGFVDPNAVIVGPRQIQLQGKIEF